MAYDYEYFRDKTLAEEVRRKRVDKADVALGAISDLIEALHIRREGTNRCCSGGEKETAHHNTLTMIAARIDRVLRG